jgi:peptidoglycan hydrolase-like protein with peptidoglycan-binding domain
MRLYFGGVALLALALCASLAAQNDQPSGTVPDKQTGGNAVQPAPAPVTVSAKDVKAAQRALNKAGYTVGTADGRMGPRTEAAITKYQSDNGLTASGKLDADTLSKLNVGAGATMAKAPHDIARGAKAAGHDVVEGHPIAAGKAMGTGVGRAGKAVGQGTKAGAMGAADKVQGKDKDDKDKDQPHQ